MANKQTNKEANKHIRHMYKKSGIRTGLKMTETFKNNRKVLLLRRKIKSHEGWIKTVCRKKCVAVIVVNLFLETQSINVRI